MFDLRCSDHRLYGRSLPGGLGVRTHVYLNFHSSGSQRDFYASRFASVQRTTRIPLQLRPPGASFGNHGPRKAVLCSTELRSHTISPDSLNELTVVTLAVFNNPDLKAARLQARVARAQMLEAGLLPDPQLNAGFASSARNYGGV